MSDARIIYLFERYINRQSSLAEEQELWQYFDDPVNEKKFKILLDDALERQTIDSSLTNEQMQRVLNNIHESQAEQLVSIPQDRSAKGEHLIKAGIAAAIALAFLTFGAYLLTKQWEEKDIAGILPIIESDEQPYYNQTVLLLSDGTAVFLDKVKNGTTIKDIGAGTEITKINAEEISYRSSDDDNMTDHTARHKLHVPFGKQLQVHLIDGSFVFLNACSTIAYHPSFSSGKRELVLDGEAFFDVAKRNGQGRTLADAPFVVKSKGQEITVLGTEFNVHAYANENEIKTTLVEGRLKVNQTLLSPGEQATYKEGEMYVETVNARQITAWSGGYFTLDKEDIYSIMRKIARWYNIKVIYQGDLPTETFGGVVAKAARVEDVLDVLTEIAGIQFEILPVEAGQKGRRIIVMP